jgi:aminoglycoside phosphotransferase (APT) family kinase protein
MGALRARLTGPLDCAPSEITAEVIDGGRSNLTYRLTAGSRRWVLRRPPLGHVLATAHDMTREYRVMSALAPAGVRVPMTVLFEDDTSVIGAPFFVMEFVDGPVIRSDADAGRLSPGDAARAADDVVDQLAALHGVAPGAVGLESLGRPDGFLRRQIDRWQRQWDASGGDDTGLPLERLADRLRDRIPSQQRSAVVHGDYRLDNTILDASDHGRVAAIIDWEMATLGDPLADLGLLLTYWSPLSAAVTGGSGHPASANPGFPASDHLISRYERASGESAGTSAGISRSGTSSWPSSPRRSTPATCRASPSDLDLRRPAPRSPGSCTTRGSCFALNAPLSSYAER